MTERLVIPDSADILLASTSQQWFDHCRSHAVPQPLALAQYRRFYRSHDQLPQLPSTATVSSVQHDAPTTKFTLRMHDGLETESVILPQTSRNGRRRNTLCLSSQVGCAMGCTFCETAQMGLLRNLSPAEIVLQWHAARFHFSTIIHNIVFMGMGEPMDNLSSVSQAVRVLTDHNGPSIAPSRISISTVGRIAGIDQLTDLASAPPFSRVGLAVSINAPNDEIRQRIMPINRAEPMLRLRLAILRWQQTTGHPVMIEYVLIPRINDHPEHADQLADFLAPLRTTINIIPYNPRRNSPWPAPSESSVAAFIDRLRAAGRFVKRRRTLGRTIMAACGQLGNEYIRNRRTVLPVALPVAG